MPRSHHQSAPMITAHSSFPYSPQLIAQAQGESATPLEEALDPRFTKEPTVTTSTNPSYTGLLILSGLTFLFLLFLLFKRRLKEVRFGVLATLLLGIALPIWTIIEITVDRLEQSTTKNPSQTADADPNAAETPSPTAEPSPPSTVLGEATVGLSIAGTVNGFSAVPEEDLVDAPSTGVVTRSGEISPTAVNFATTDSGRSNSTAIATSPTDTASRGSDVITHQAARPPSQALAIGGTVPSSPIQGSMRVTRPIPPLESINWTEPIAFRRLLKPSWTGLDVLVLQKLLQDLGYYDDALDGHYGEQTILAVQAFQRANNLQDDGIVGFSTCEILDAQTSEVSLECRE